MTRKKKRKKIAKAIRLAYASLKSHLPYAYKKLGKKYKKGYGRTFDIECVQEYAYIIRVLSKLY